MHAVQWYSRTPTLSNATPPAGAGAYSLRCLVQLVSRGQADPVSLSTSLCKTNALAVCDLGTDPREKVQWFTGPSLNFGYFALRWQNAGSAPGTEPG